MKLYINPSFTGPDKADGGIRRVIEAMVKYLPSHGIEMVHTAEEADILNFHAASYTDYANKPMVASCHGLYWTNYDWENYYHQANQAVIEVMARAQAVTVPSKWVGTAVSRGILHSPHVIHHGVDVEKWQPVATTKLNHNYVLWNKARSDIISNPNDLIQIAKEMPKTKFLSTIGRQSANLEIMGVVPHRHMVGAIKNAGVYLATARETFGIGTIEALAAGVPVAGWDFGGQSEIINQGETGYLAPYGDYAGLKECIHNCFTQRTELSKNARADAIKRWGWKDKIAQYASLFWQVYKDWHKEGPKFSIIIPAYNLANYLPTAVDSALAQTTDDYECIIIDDCSTDYTEQIGRDYATNNTNVSYVKTPKNSGLCNVRNYGYKIANGRYIMYLDADDRITPNALEILGDYLDSNAKAHIAYGRIDFMNHTGDSFKQGDNPSPYNWLRQMAHSHQFPIGASLIRKEALVRSGGFRVRDWRAEDASWVARVTSMGIRAYKATDDAILIYRIHSESKSNREAQADPNDRDGNWLAWLGWRLADNRADGERAVNIGRTPPWPLVPFGSQHPPNDPPHWNIDHRQDPLVSVIIPVGAGHHYHVMEALDSLLAQNVPYWEAVVVNDTGSELDISYAPWATLVITSGKKGAGYARNRGVEASRAPLIYFLDSDDWLLAGGLDAMVRAWIDENGEKYIYTDYIDMNGGGQIKHQSMKAYNQQEWKLQHAVNILISKEDFWRVGGFDEDMIGWEDWDLPLKLAVTGLCGHHIKDETFVYRTHTGELRNSAFDRKKDLLSIIRERYGPYYDRRIKMSKCCGGSNAAQTILKARAAYGDLSAANALKKSSEVVQRKVDSVRLEFVGVKGEKRTFIRVNGRSLTKSYKGSTSANGRFINAHPSDVDLLLMTGKWKRVARAKRQTANLPSARRPVDNLDIGPSIPAPPIVIEMPEKTAVVATPAPAPQATRAAARLAKANGIDISTLKGGGKNGKITIADVREALR